MPRLGLNDLELNDSCAESNRYPRDAGLGSARSGVSISLLAIDEQAQKSFRAIEY